MPSGPIQTQAQGLLGFLQLKNAGRNPDALLETVQPSLDLRDWYFNSVAETLISQSEAVAGGFNGNALLATPGGQVPSNEFWYVHFFAMVTGTMAATDSLSMAPAMQWSPNIGGAVTLEGGTLGAAPLAGSAAGRTQSVVVRNFWVPPGAIFAMCIGECISATSVSVASRVWGTRLRPI